STSKTPSYTKSVSWQHHPKIKLYKKTENIVLHELFILTEKEIPVISVAANRLRHCIFFWLNFLRIKSIFHSS
ncbi:hypothetical protein, partial [Pantoea septica]|uniref:hypothetical protein n=1 Tax=Pantoea septica TaxID=472695 RepID=UPI00289B9E8C